MAEEIVASIGQENVDYAAETKRWLARWSKQPHRAPRLAQIGLAQQQLGSIFRGQFMDGSSSQMVHRWLTQLEVPSQEPYACAYLSLQSWYQRHWLADCYDKDVKLQQHGRYLQQHLHQQQSCRWLNQALPQTLTNFYQWRQDVHESSARSVYLLEQTIDHLEHQWFHALNCANEIQIMWLTAQQQFHDQWMTDQNTSVQSQVGLAWLQRIQSWHPWAQTTLNLASSHALLALLLYRLALLHVQPRSYGQEKETQWLHQCHVLVQKILYYRQNNAWPVSTQQACLILRQACCTDDLSYQRPWLLAKFHELHNELRLLAPPSHSALPLGRREQIVGVAMQRAQLMHQLQNTAFEPLAFPTPTQSWRSCLSGSIALPRLAIAPMAMAWVQSIGRRLQQQDRFCWHAWPEHDVACVALFDGHGEADVAIFAAEQFPQLVLEHVLAIPPQDRKDITIVRQALKACFAPKTGQVPSISAENTTIVSSYRPAHLHHLVQQFTQGRSTRWQGGGSTALAAVWIHNTCYIANLGDSTALLIEPEGTYWPLSLEHTLDNPWERARVLEAGGQIIDERLAGALVPTRALGNRFLEDLPCGSQHALKRRPQITAVPMHHEKDCLLLLATDGLFEGLDSPTVAHFVAQQWQSGTPLVQIGQGLVRASQERGSQDNQSVMLILPVS